MQSLSRKDGTYNRTPHGGVATFIHSSIPYETVELNTPLQAVAVRVQLHKLITVCNIYSPVSQILNCQLLQDIYRQLPQPAMILGDFNAHNRMWGSDGTDASGREVEEFTTVSGINIMNDGAVTFIGYNAETSIDLTMCSASLEADLHWSVATSHGAGDYCSILIT